MQESVGALLRGALPSCRMGICRTAVNLAKQMLIVTLMSLRFQRSSSIFHTSACNVVEQQFCAETRLQDSHEPSRIWYYVQAHILLVVVHNFI